MIPLPLEKGFLNPKIRGINTDQVEVRMVNFPDRFERENVNGESDFYVFYR